MITKLQYLDDLEFLKKTLEEVHPNIYAHWNKEDALKAYEKIRLIINNEISLFEFALKITKYVARFKDGHTRVDLAGFLTPSSNTKLPFYFNCISDRVYLKDVLILNSLQRGDEVISINGKDVAELLKELAPFSLSELDARTQNAACNFYLNRFYYDLFPNVSKSNGEVIVKDANDIVKSINFCPVSMDEYLPMFERNCWNQFYKKLEIEDQIAVLKFNQFAYDQEHIDFFSNVFKELKEKGINRLIIDLSDNGGGSELISDHILSFITDGKFSYNDNETIKTSSISLAHEKQYQHLINEFDNEQKKIRVSSRNNPFRFYGQIVLLIGGKTFSSAIGFSSQFYRHKIGRIIGEESGAPLNNFGDCIPLQLPNSKINFHVSYKYFETIKGHPEGRGVIPDYEVKMTPEDLREGRDPVLEFAKQLLKNG